VRKATKPRFDPPWRVIDYTPLVSKAVRLATQTIRFEQGAFLFPVEADFLEELKREMVMFGHAKHDDQVDSVTQFVAWASSPGGQRALNTIAGRKARATRSSRRG